MYQYKISEMQTELDSLFFLSGWDSLEFLSYGFIFIVSKKSALQWQFFISVLWSNWSSDFKDAIFNEDLFHAHTFQSSLKDKYWKDK